MSTAEGQADWVRAHVAGLASWGVRYLARAAASPETAIDLPPADVPAIETKRTASSEALGDGADFEAATPTAVAPVTAECGDRVAALGTEASRVAECVRCGLATTRTKTVYGVGDPHARLMFVGEAPGREEDLQGEPFVGKAGQLLDRIIGALGVARQDVYIANVLKCRPPNNRDPLPDEVACCAPFLTRQIELVAPEMIVALGRPAANFLLNSGASLADLRGRQHEYRGIPVVATYHPAYLLRNPDAKKLVWQDLQVVIQKLDLPGPPTRE